MRNSFRDFVYAAVQRYGSDVKYWKIWAETNTAINIWVGDTINENDLPNPNIYAKLMQKVYPEIKDKVKVVFAGLSYADAYYLQGY